MFLFSLISHIRASGRGNFWHRVKCHLHHERKATESVSCRNKVRKCQDLPGKSVELRALGSREGKLECVFSKAWLIDLHGATLTKTSLHTLFASTKTTISYRIFRIEDFENPRTFRCFSSLSPFRNLPTNLSHHIFCRASNSHYWYDKKKLLVEIKIIITAVQKCRHKVNVLYYWMHGRDGYRLAPKGRCNGRKTV